MNKTAKKRIITIKCFEDLNGLIGGTDLQLNIDLSKEAASKCNYLGNASNIIEYTEAYEKTIDYRLKYLKHPDSYIGLRPITESTYDFNNERSLKQISLLVCQGTTIVLEVSASNPYNTLFSLILLSIFQTLESFDDLEEAPQNASFDDECTTREYLLNSKHLPTPCLLGYSPIDNHDELQWSLNWNPRPYDIKWDGNMDMDKGSSEYNTYASRDSMFILTRDNQIHFDNINNNDIINPNRYLRVLRREKDSFISAFAMNYKKGSLIITPAHCRDEVVALFESKEDIHFTATIAPTGKEGFIDDKIAIEITDLPKLEQDDNNSCKYLDITVKTPFSENKDTGHKFRLHHLLKFLIIYQLTEDDTPLLYCTKDALEKLDKEYPGKYKCLMTAQKGSNKELNDFDFIDFFIKGKEAPVRGIKPLKRSCSYVLTGEQESDKVNKFYEDIPFNLNPKGFLREPYKKFNIINCDIKLADGFIEFCKKIDFEEFNSDLIITFTGVCTWLLGIPYVVV